MKKLITILLMLMMLPICALGQKLKENSVDKFTGQTIVSTTQEALAKRNKWKSQWQQVLVSIRNVNGEWVMPAFIELSEIEKYDENSKLIILLSNGEKVVTPSMYTGIGAEDCPIGLGGVNSHVHGFSTVFPLSDSDINLLRNYNITDIRVTTLGSNHDFAIGKKEQDLVRRMIEIIDNAITSSK